MNTLPNVNTQRGGVTPPSARHTTGTIPEAVSSRTGVSVGYVPDDRKQWYVFRASYNREDQARDVIVEDGAFVYIAKRYVRKSINGKITKILESLIPNLLFVYTTKEKAEEYVKYTPVLSFISYYYNHFEYDGYRRNPPLTVLRSEMENFILATCNKSEHLLFVDESLCHYKSGEIVRVTDGPFKGVEGKIARVSGQQRVVVSISNVGLISTAYIPTAFLEKL